MIKCFSPDKGTFIFIVLSFIFVSCDNDVVYNKFYPVQNKNWSKQSAFCFEFDITDNTIPYLISAQLRNNNMYPYQNIWLFWEKQSGNNVTKDTIEYMLADALGKWTGSGITLFQSKVRLHHNYYFPSTGKCKVCVHHGMRTKNLTGIEDIGLLVEKAK